jgi:hypothetical protein
MKPDPDPGAAVFHKREPATADVFMSYAREDRAVAEAIASALGRHGITVWWDRKIVVGCSFSETIERELAGAKCVVVLWSRASVASEWVSNEAAEGVRRQILVPLCVDDVIPPLEFRRRQTARLLDQRDIESNPEFPDCLAAIRALIEGDGAEEPAPVERRPDAVLPMLGKPRWLYAAPLIALVVLAASLFLWRHAHEQQSSVEPSPIAENTLAGTAPAAPAGSAPSGSNGAQGTATQGSTTAQGPAPAQTATAPQIPPATQTASTAGASTAGASTATVAPAATATYTNVLPPAVTATVSPLSPATRRMGSLAAVNWNALRAVTQAVNPYPFTPVELLEYRYPAGGKECKGYFLSDGAGRWAERTFGKNGCIDTHYEFREQSRRAGEALLFDSSRGYYIRIPLQGGQSLLATSPTGPWGGLHDVIVSK